MTRPREREGVAVASETIDLLTIRVPQRDLDDLRARLQRTR